jgi:hypothetical protein
MDMSRYALPLLETTPLIFGLAILAWMYPEGRHAKAPSVRMNAEEEESASTKGA